MIALIRNGGDDMSRAYSKYNVDLQNKEKRTFDGIVFDSAGEMKMYRDCLLPQLESGKIRKIDRQCEFLLQEGYMRGSEKIQPITYVADFVVEFTNGDKVVLDFKGMPDSVSKIKRKLFEYKYDLPLYWIAYSKIDGGYVPYELVQKNRKERRKVRQNEEKKEMAIDFHAVPKKKKVNRHAFDTIVQNRMEEANYTIVAGANTDKPIEITFRSVSSSVLQQACNEMVFNSSIQTKEIAGVSVPYIDSTIMDVTIHLFIISQLSNLDVPVMKVTHEDGTTSEEIDGEAVAAYGAYFYMESEAYMATFGCLKGKAYKYCKSILDQYFAVVESTMANLDMNALMQSPQVLNMIKDVVLSDK